MNDRLLHKPLIEARNWQIKVTYVGSHSLQVVQFFRAIPYVKKSQLLPFVPENKKVVCYLFYALSKNFSLHAIPGPYLEVDA